MNKLPIILASNSPRRIKMLQDNKIYFITMPADIDETPTKDETPQQLVIRLANSKADYIAKQHPLNIIIAADTIVADNNKLLGKPKDLKDAEKMLLSLSNKSHHVFTGVAIKCANQNINISWICDTKITFKKFTIDDVQRYFNIVNPLDKAGSYAIQEHSEWLIEKIEGSYNNVVGLPIEEVINKLKNIDQQ